jgi:chemotaxis methyl-accepting protein methylase
MSFLEKTVENRMAALALGGSSAYLRYIAENPGEITAFVQSLEVTFSEFFRDPLAVALLAQLVLPRLLEDKSIRGEIRVWSAGCAAGQETYSLAMQLDDLAARWGAPCSWRIFGTDASDDELARAREGVYDVSAVQNVPLKFIRHYFQVKGDRCSVVHHLRDRLTFSRYDLLDRNSTSPPESIYGNFDLVLCSNLLFYYRPGVQRFILAKLRRVIVPGGYLVTGEAERAIVEKMGGFQMVAVPAGVFRKTDTG